MANKYSLYTVRGARETYYAAVDWDGGRVWTAPNRDGAIQQARAAGLETFTEQNTTKDELLRALGVGGDMKVGRSDKSPKGDSPRRGKATIGAASSNENAPTTWFTPPAGAAAKPEDGKVFRISRPTKPNKKSSRSRKSGNSSPFAGNRPISAAGGDDIAEIGDMPTISTPPESSKERTPFSEAEPIDPPLAPDKD